MRLIDLREPGVDDLLVELILLLEAEHLRRLLGEDVDDAVEDRVVEIRVVDGDRFDLLAERRARSMAVMSAPNDCGLPSTPTRIVSRSGSPGSGTCLTTQTSRSDWRATRSQTEPITLSRARPIPRAPITTRSLSRRDP